MFSIFTWYKEKNKRSYSNVLFVAIPFLLSLQVSCSTKDKLKEYDIEKIEYGRQILLSALNEVGVDTNSVKLKFESTKEELPQEFQIAESYLIQVDSVIKVIGADASGVMYGCIDLAERIVMNQQLPIGLSWREKPMMKLRGVCILMMKLGTYNYPITPDHFPFFYDKELWIDYLNFLAANRYNYITLWNGHPFDYFVKLDKYPEAQSGLDPEVLAQNHHMMKWLIKEGAKRNIRFFWEFYNIHTSVYYQSAHHLPDELSVPTKELTDYASYCIEQFVNEFPEIGLYITAGEALDKSYSVQWVNEVILATVKKTGKKPAIILRSWFLDLDAAKKIVKDHPNIFIESKYNVEMVADTLIDPMNQEWAKLTNNFIVNIHMAGNLEPFRWNPPFYIQQCLQSAYRIGTNGFHLYPRKSWRWPLTNEIGSQQLQWQRDELWYRMWGRYSWNCQRDNTTEQEYWTNFLSAKYGSRLAASHLLESFEEIADVLPAIQRLFWAGHDNHTVVTSGLMVRQIERAPGIPFLALNDVKRIPDFLEDSKSNSHSPRKSPIDFLQEKQKSCERAIEKIKLAIPHATKDQQELNKYLIDLEAVQLTLQFYLEKLQAVYFYHQFNSGAKTKENADQFLSKLKSSLAIYQKLTQLTDGFYDSISDVPAAHPVYLEKTPYHWKDLLPYYEKEYQVYYEALHQLLKREDNRPADKGLVGLVFGDPYLSKPRRTFIAETLEFDWPTNPPDDGRNWSVLLTGFIKSPLSGKVQFMITSEQEVLITINDCKIAKKSAKQMEAAATLEMVQDQWYPIRIEYNNVDFKGGNLIIHWALPGKTRSKIAGDYLSHSENDIGQAKRSIILGF